MSNNQNFVIESSARVLQQGGKRVSIKLEDLFWKQLDEIAYDQGLTLSQLVHQTLENVPPSLNKTSALRVFCLKELQERINVLDVNGISTNVTGLLAACPLPAFVLSSARKITAFNQAFKTSFLIDDFSVSKDHTSEPPRLTFSQPLNRIISYLNKHPKKVITGQMGFQSGGKDHFHSVRYAVINKTHVIVFVDI